MAAKTKTTTKKAARGSSKTAKTTIKRPHYLFLVAAVALALCAIIAWALMANKKEKHVLICNPDSLSLQAGEQNPAAGTVYQRMIITNTGDRQCSLAGYPTAFLFAENGFAAGSSAAAQPQPTPNAISLKKGESAFTILGYPQAYNFNPGICSEASQELKLYIPGATTPLSIPLAMAWCPGFSATALQAEGS